MSSKTYSIVLWLSVLGSIALVVGGMFWLASGGGQPKPVPIQAINEVGADEHTYGKADSKVTLVEYADYQCPGCAEIYPVIKDLKKNYGDRVRFVYRIFPIPGHANGLPTAYAATAAGNQGKFWEMTDELFTHQADWAKDDAGSLAKTLDSYAKNIGLDMAKFNADQASDAVKQRIDKDAQTGVKNGIDSTPSFFLNGTKIQSVTYDEFASKLDAALQAGQ